MSNNGAKRSEAKPSVAQLEGREFKIVKQGLDMDQVSAFLKELARQRDELIDERDRLRQREEHMASLTELAEKTVIEADKLSQEIKRESLGRTRAEAAQVMENVKGLLLGVYDELFQRLESLKGQVEASRQTFGQNLSQFADTVASLSVSEESASAPTVTAEPAAESKAVSGVPEAAIEITDDMRGEMPAEARDSGEIATPTSDTEMAEKKPASEDSLVTKINNREIQLDILPPIDIAKISKIITSLYELPEVEDAELVPGADKPSIVVLQREPIELLELSRMLTELPQVDEARVMEAEGATDDGALGLENGRRRIEIALSGVKVEG